MVPRGWVSQVQDWYHVDGLVRFKTGTSQVQDWYHVAMLVQDGSAVGRSDGGISRREIRRRGQP